MSEQFDNGNGETYDEVQRAKDGDEESFAQLYSRLSPALYAWASLRIHRQYQSKMDPEDIVQDVWWRAMDSLERFEPAKGSFRTWLFKIATNSLLAGFRRMRVRGDLAQEHGRLRIATMPQELIAQVTSISASAKNDESVRGVIDSVRALDADDRALFIHCALEGLTARESAKLIGITEDAAAKRWQRLRTRFRESTIWQDFLSDQ